jgi:hypothetical protein
MFSDPVTLTLKLYSGERNWLRATLLPFGSAGVDIILGHVDKIVSDVKSYDRVIHAIVRAYSRDDDRVSARAQINLLQLFFHGSLIEAVVGVLVYHNLAEL